MRTLTYTIEGALHTIGVANKCLGQSPTPLTILSTYPMATLPYALTLAKKRAGKNACIRYPEMKSGLNIIQRGCGLSRQ